MLSIAFPEGNDLGWMDDWVGGWMDGWVDVLKAHWYLQSSSTFLYILLCTQERDSGNGIA